MTITLDTWRWHRATSAIVEAGWLATVVLVPLAVNPWGFNHELTRVALLRALTLLMAAAHLVALAWAPQPPDLRRWLRRPLVRPTLLIAGTVLISTLTSISPLVSLWGSYHRQQGAYLLLCFVTWTLLVATHLRTPAQRRRLITAMVVTGSLVALTPFAEALYKRENPLTERPGGTLGNPIFLGAYLIMVIPFALTKVWQCLMASKRPRPSGIAPSKGILAALARTNIMGWAMALILQLFALLITQSRGPWLGALVGSALFIALMLWHRHRRLVLTGLVVVPLLIAGLVAGLNFGLAPSAPLSQLPYVRRVVVPQEVQSGTLRVRLVLWRAAAGVVTAWPEVGSSPDRLHALRLLLGYGPDTAAIVYTAAYPPELAHIEDPSAIWDRAHNETLDLLTMQGWLGLAVTVVLGMACARRGLTLWRTAKDPIRRAWAAAPLAALAAHLVEIQFAFSLTAKVMMTWLCVAWLAASPPSRAQQEEDGKSQVVGQRAVSRWPVYAAVGALLLVLVAARLEGGAIWADTLVSRARTLDRAGQWKESIELYDRALVLVPWQATYHQFRAEALYNLARALPEGQTALQNDLLAAADRSLARARRLEPLDMEHYSNGGVLHAYWSETVDPAHLKTAITFYQQACELAPTRAELLVDLGHVYHNHSLYEEALGQYRTALTIDPQSAAAHYASGLAWQALGQLDRARHFFQTALELAPDCSVCREALQMPEK